MRPFDFSPLFRSTVGFDRLFDMMDSVPEQAPSYPPYNIERADETHYRITLAVAGFADRDLDVNVRDGVLIVTGRHDGSEENAARYLYQGIAGRSFERRFQLAEYVEVRNAKLENGLLHIDLERVVPEEKKPRRIPICAVKNTESLEAPVAA